MIKIVFFLLLLSMSTNAQIHFESDSIFFKSCLTELSKKNNYQRFCKIKKCVKDNNLLVHTESIDWFGIYKNIVVEKKGKCDSIVYIVCHYDKIDGNIFASLNSFLNGNLDIIFSPFYLSKGAYDNGTGVVTSLGLLNWIKTRTTNYTYRFLFAGMEEYGLRGSRRHVSGLKNEDWKKCVCAINIDMIGGQNMNGISLTKNVSDSVLIAIADSTAYKVGLKIIKCDLPKGALSDYYSFIGQSFKKDIDIAFKSSFIGAVIPQRSYFTKTKKGIPVIDFSDDIKIENSKVMLSYFSPVSFGEIHSYKDNIAVVDYKNINNYQIFFKEFINRFDGRYH